jgi:hypothetical protein
MIRTVIFMALIAMSILIASCSASRCVAPLTRTTRETLKMIKKEVRRTIKVTTEKVKCNDVDFQVGNEIIDSLTRTIKEIDSLIASTVKLEKRGRKEEILRFAESTYRVIIATLTNLKSLEDLYDISTCSEFETATFFPADSISIPSEKIDEAKKAIEPVVQRIVRFISDHPREKFEAVITCYCTPAGQKPNVKLCTLRARGVANLLTDQIRSNEEFIAKPEWILYNIKCVSKEDGLPYTSRRKHHKREDKRRNTVSLTWNVVPASLHAASSDH